MLLYFDDFVLDNIPPGSTVLDIGCGIGWLTQKIGAKAFSVAAIDIDEEDIHRAKKLNHNNRITFSVMSGEHLAFPAETFDVVVSRLTFHHLDHAVGRVVEAAEDRVNVHQLELFQSPRNAVVASPVVVVTPTVVVPVAMRWSVGDEEEYARRVLPRELEHVPEAALC